MITEDYVRFETAKLLKNKGFDENTPVNYFIGDDKPRGCVVGEMIYHKRAEEDTHLIACPTIQIARKWLEKEKKLYVNVWADPKDAENNDFRIVHRLQVFDGKTNYGTFEFPSHEKACEAGIRFCLENLI